MSEPTRQEKIDRGREARIFLESKLFADVLLACRDVFVGRWQESDFDDPKMREAAYHSIHALAEIETQIKRIANEGMFEEAAAAKQK
jgi:hypothetical protein